jgi:hypothetical protein
MNTVPERRRWNSDRTTHYTKTSQQYNQLILLPPLNQLCLEMGAINDPDVEDTGGNDSVDVEMNPDTSHDSSAPLLACEDVSTIPHSIVRNNNTPSPVSWHDITTAFPWVASIYNNFPGRDNKAPESPASWLQIIATVFPWVVVFLSMPALSTTVDTQSISVLAFLQVVAIGSLGFLMSPVSVLNPPYLSFTAYHFLSTEKTLHTPRQRARSSKRLAGCY